MMTDAEIDALLDIRLNVMARRENGAYTPELAASWLETVDARLEAHRAERATLAPVRA